MVVPKKKIMKLVQIVVSTVLLIVVFRKIDMVSLFTGMAEVPLWFILASFLLTIFSTLVISVRWSLLLLPKITIKDILFFSKASLMGRYYSLFLSSSMGGDLVKWLPLMKKYPELSKIRLASSVLLDRIIGFTAFVIVAFVSIVVGMVINLDFPIYIFWIFLGLFVGVMVFYTFVFFFDFEKVFKYLKLPKKIIEAVEILTKTEKNRLIKSFMISILTAPIWSFTGWLAFFAFDTGISLMATMIIMPIINLILILPVSVAGFGAREGLFVYFFSKFAVSSESILASSAFAGVLGIVFSLLGGILTLF